MINIYCEECGFTFEADVEVSTEGFEAKCTNCFTLWGFMATPHSILLKHAIYKLNKDIYKEVDIMDFAPRAAPGHTSIPIISACSQCQKPLAECDCLPHLTRTWGDGTTPKTRA